MTIKKYADKCNITPQAAHKRLKKVKQYPEIISFERINANFFLIEVNPSKGYSKSATMLQR